MAIRPVFVSAGSADDPVAEVPVSFTWHPGFALAQKRRNVHALHAAAARAGLGPLLEVSTKSEDALGQALSAFHLRVATAAHGEIPLECAFQGSKVFVRGGPYTDLYEAEPRAAKRDLRLRESGEIVAFRFGGQDFPILPRTLFYDWLYFQAVRMHPDRLAALCAYAGFTDIEFNPARSFSCQARTCALLAALQTRGLLAGCIDEPACFLTFLNDADAAKLLSA